MYVNDRDQINYHGFLKSLREMQGATLNHVAQGICSDSEVSRTEIGDRLPEKLMRDRITSRLGVSGEEYEEYLRPEEYRQWEIRMHIVDAINRKDEIAIQKGMDEYQKIEDKNPVQEQFIEVMRYMVAQMKGASKELLCAMIELAIAHTIPDIDVAFQGCHLLADQELNLIAEYTYLREYYGNKENEYEWRLFEYDKILNYMDNSYMDMIAKSKVYPKTACYICEWMLSHKPKKRELEKALELCNTSISLLRDVSRLYYFIELLEYRKEIVQRLLKVERNEAKRTLLHEVYEKDNKWEIFLKERYTEYDVPIYMQNFTYLYVETECDSVVEVIRTRRNMLKLSRVKVSDNICTEKTIERFENYTHSPSIVIIRDIFERIGLCAEYKRARVITDNAELFQLYNRLIHSVNNYEYKEWRSLLDELSDKIHMDISYNQQVVDGLYNLLAYMEGEINEEEFTINAVKAMERTVHRSAIIRRGSKYLTREEMSCLYDMAFRGIGDSKMYGLAMVSNYCSKLDTDDYAFVRLFMYEWLVSKLASYMGNLERYDQSVEWSDKILKLCLTHRRMDVLTDNLYNKVWNYQHMPSIDDMIIKNKMQDCLTMSEIANKAEWVQFLEKKLLEFG